jgi:hypothetical protein
VPIPRAPSRAETAELLLARGGRPRSNVGEARLPLLEPAVVTPRSLRLRRAAWLLIAAFAAFRFWFNGVLPISGDEAYHWAWSRHLEAAYHDHGGVLAASVWLAGHLLDPHTERSVRLAALVYMTLAAVVGAGLARRVARERGADVDGVERAGLYAVLGLGLPPVFAVLQGYNVTDGPAIFFVLLTLDQVHRGLTRGGARPWALAGLAMAAAAQSKFLTLGLLPAGALLLWRQRREAAPVPLRHVGLAALTFCLGLVPLIAWNAQNHWATIRFNFLDRHDRLELGWETVLEFLGAQLVAMSPVLVVALTIVVVRQLRHGTRDTTPGTRVLAFGAGVPLALFALMASVRMVGIHWPTSAWAPAAVLASAAVVSPGVRPLIGPRLWRWSLRIAALFFVGMHLAPLVPVLLMRLDIGGIGRAGQVHTRKIAEIWGWEELAQAALRIRGEMARGSECGAFVITNQFGVACLLQFYSRSTLDPKLWSVVKDHGESLRRWQHLPDQRGADALFVCKRNVEAELGKLEEHFDRVERPQELVIEQAGRPVRSFWLVRCHGYDGREPYPLEH